MAPLSTVEAHPTALHAVGRIAVALTATTSAPLPSPRRADEPVATRPEAAPMAARPLPVARSAAPQQDQAPPQRPVVVDPAGGPVFSIVGGSVFSGASAFQAGAAMAYFFGAKAAVGFEIEGTATFGTRGRLTQVMASLVLQAGARTSKFVPYVALGGGYLNAKTSLPTATREILDDFGIALDPTSENGPFVHYGGGLRFYVTPTVAFRGDVRFAQVLLDIERDKLSDRLFPMRRIAGMLSWDF